MCFAGVVNLMKIRLLPESYKSLTATNCYKHLNPTDSILQITTFYGNPIYFL